MITRPFVTCALVLTVLVVWPLSAKAQIPLQNNPVFTTPAPDAQTIGPQPEKAFQKNVLEPPSVPNPQVQLETIEFEGNRYYQDSVIERQVHPLRSSPTLPVSELEQRLVTINRNNPFKLRGRIVHDESSDQQKLLLNVHERQPWQLSTTMDNQGRPRTGTLRGGMQLVNDSLFGYADKLNVQYIGAEGHQFITGSYDVPFNRYGGTLGVLTEYTHVNVEGLGFHPDPDGE